MWFAVLHIVSYGALVRLFRYSRVLLSYALCIRGGRSSICIGSVEFRYLKLTVGKDKMAY